MPPARAPALLLALALLLAPAALADSLADATGDAEDGGLDVLSVAWTVGNGTVTLEVRFAAGDLPDDRAVRGLLMLGEPGSAEPAEWYQVTIANATHAFAGHTTSDASIVGTSWTGDLARVELERQQPAPAGSCAFAVVEAGRLTEEGFVRSDVAPTGFASPEDAWADTRACPEAEPAAAMPEPEEKDSPALPLLGLVAAFLVVLSRRRR